MALVERLRQQVGLLWDRLLVPLEERDEFEMANEGHKPKVIKAVRICLGSGGGGEGSSPGRAWQLS